MLKRRAPPTTTIYLSPHAAQRAANIAHTHHVAPESIIDAAIWLLSLVLKDSQCKAKLQSVKPQAPRRRSACVSHVSSSETLQLLLRNPAPPKRK